MKRYTFLIFCFLLIPIITYSQVTIGSLKAPEKAALLDLKTDVDEAAMANNESSDKGLLLSRVWLTNLYSLDPFINLATNEEKEQHIGLMVYNLNATSPLQKGLYTWNGNSWEYGQQSLPSAYSAANGLSMSSNTLSLGGTLIEGTIVNQANNNLKFENTTGVFSVNTTSLAVSNGYTGLGITPTSTSKVTIGKETNIQGNLKALESTSSLKQTTVTDTLTYVDSSVSNPERYVLQSMDNTGKATWADINTVPGLIGSPYIEGEFTGNGISMPIKTWNNTNNLPINTAKITLPPGLWLVYLSLVVEPEILYTANADPIWGRFTLRVNDSATPGTDTSGYSELGTGTSGNIYRIGALNISDRVYPNVKKNVIKGYVIIRVKNSPRNLYIWVGDRSTSSGYVTWPTSVSNVKIGDSNDLQNYMVAFAL